jgi:hypothetical protein
VNGALSRAEYCAVHDAPDGCRGGKTKASACSPGIVPRRASPIALWRLYDEFSRKLRESHGFGVNCAEFLNGEIRQRGGEDTHAALYVAGRGVFVGTVTHASLARNEEHAGGSDPCHEKRIVISAADHCLERQA